MVVRTQAALRNIANALSLMLSAQIAANARVVTIGIIVFILEIELSKVMKQYSTLKKHKLKKP